MVAATFAKYWPWQDRQGRFSPVRAAALMVAAAPGASMLFDTLAENYGPIPVQNLLYWSGLWATVLLLLTLSVTPVRTVFRWNRLIAARRILGIAGLGYTLFHVVAYVALDEWDVMRVAGEMSAMTVNIVSATLATIGLLALGVTSFDAAVRRMGPGWQRLHSLIFALTFLSILHFLLSRGMFQVSYFFAGSFAWLMAWRALARFGKGTDPVALSILAAVAAVFTLALEALWMQAHHGVDALVPLADNFTFQNGPTPAWQVLFLGLLVALSAGLVRMRASRAGAA